SMSLSAGYFVCGSAEYIAVAGPHAVQPVPHLLLLLGTFILLNGLQGIHLVDDDIEIFPVGHKCNQGIYIVGIFNSFQMCCVMESKEQRMPNRPCSVFEKTVTIRQIHDALPLANELAHECGEDM